MLGFLLGFTVCYVLGGAATAKFVSDMFANEGRLPPAGGQWVTLALWPRMLWVIGRD